MIIGDDWFTKSMLVNTIARNEKLQAQIEKSGTGNENLFSTVLNQLIKQQEMAVTGKLPTTTLIPEMLFGKEPIPNFSISPLGVAKTNQPLSYRELSAEKINQVLEGRLVGKGEAFVRAGQQYNIDPGLLTAIAQHETGNGKSRAAFEKNNIAGMMGKNGLRSYATVEDSIMDLARNLSKNYLGKGLSTITEIGAKYAPVRAKNDPTGLNNHWVNGVSKLINQFV